MRLLTAVCLALLVGYSLSLPDSLAQDAPPPKAAADDAKRIEGTWKVTALEADGMKAPPKVFEGGRWIFKGSELLFETPGEKSEGKTAVKLDPGKTPKHIDLVGLEGPQKGKKLQGIYKFEKDRLVICLRDEGAAKKGRPTEFKTEADSGLGMITLERVKE